ncbi:16S rRNA (guanine(527)-N(7))-methyltransferase RsmG [Tsuneonella amylolytica]|uniref:16S rRNA (guanine(527)-N(7))-methyltransferase RsmG n=1 Tax=Tsuneonella amylolytica TaxID=2338327 RepID=UPI000EA8E839|nr:16S rRNA (guanine(527)-N(7))-methyltransferase RsmG [Tsuneonella amylolytica]
MISSEEDALTFVGEHHSDAVQRKLASFVTALQTENKKQNLVSAQSLNSVWQRHIVDSLQLARFVPRETLGPWIDLGTGAGLPGLVMAIAREDAEIILVESRAKRIEWLKGQIASLNLPNCVVRGARLETLDPIPVSVISARAFAPLTKLVRLAARFSTPDTIWLLPKGRSAAQEVAELPPRLRSLFHVEQSVTDPDAGIIVGKGLEAKAI